MAKLSAHGTELLRVEQASCRLAYMADGKILRDSGGGWKLHKRCKPGVDPEANAEQRRAFYANVTPDRYHRAHYRERMVNEFPGLETRVRVHTTISLMPDDVSARSGDKHWLLLGPFVDDHAAALRMVEPVRALANQHEPRSAFYAFGTCRYQPGETQPGSANRHFPECFSGEQKAAA
jgi:hypothetical protein